MLVALALRFCIEELPVGCQEAFDLLCHHHSPLSEVTHAVCATVYKLPFILLCHFRREYNSLLCFPHKYCFVTTISDDYLLRDSQSGSHVGDVVHRDLHGRLLTDEPSHVMIRVVREELHY